MEVGLEKRCLAKHMEPALSLVFRNPCLEKGLHCSPALLRTLLDCNLERQAEEFDCALHIVRLLQIDAHPAALRKDVVGFSSTGGHQFISDHFWKGDVHKMVAVHMADFPSPEAIFRASKAMWLGFNPGPIFQSVIDSGFRSGDRHAYLSLCPSLIRHIRLDVSFRWQIQIDEIG